VAFKQKFYYTKSAHYETATLKSVRLVPESKIIQSLKDDYAAMANMFYGAAPAFDEILNYLKELEKEIHELSVSDIEKRQ